MKDNREPECWTRQKNLPERERESKRERERDNQREGGIERKEGEKTMEE